MNKTGLMLDIRVTQANSRLQFKPPFFARGLPLSSFSPIAHQFMYQLLEIKGFNSRPPSVSVEETVCWRP